MQKSINSTQKLNGKLLAGLALALILLSLTYRLVQVPPLWFDEGWTMTVARNWVVDGWYGQYLAGQPRDSGLAAAFPVVASAALSFKLFGVGVWQARLPFVLYTLGAAVALFYLAKKLYSNGAAWAALLILMFGQIWQPLNAFLAARQVLGEPVVMFCLLVGYVTLFLALHGSGLWIVLAALLWGVGIYAKAQPLPFWLASLALPLIVALYKGWRRPALMLVAGGVGALVVWALLIPWVQNLILAGRSLPATMISGALQTIILQLDPQVRLQTLLTVLTIVLPTFLGTVWAAWWALRGLRSVDLQPPQEILRWTLVGFTLSWYAWYILGAIPWYRYIYPAAFVGCLFFGALLEAWTYHFDLRRTIGDIIVMFKAWRTRNTLWPGLRSLFLIFWLEMVVLSHLMLIGPTFFPTQAVSPQQAAAYLNAQTPPGALIETYEPELFFFLNRTYHYPPDQLSLDIVKKHYVEGSMDLGYNVLESDPDYLVIGAMARMWGFYNPWLNSGDFRLVQDVGDYQIYERVRSK
jgi:hypothetical protein